MRRLHEMAYGGGIRPEHITSGGLCGNTGEEAEDCSCASCQEVSNWSF